jgi:hypothetical protein
MGPSKVSAAPPPMVFAFLLRMADLRPPSPVWRGVGGGGEFCRFRGRPEKGCTCSDPVLLRACWSGIAVRVQEKGAHRLIWIGHRFSGLGR